MPETKKERICCSGPNWEGDGSKATSACKFGDSMAPSEQFQGSDAYKCSRCASGQTVTKKQGVAKALEITPQSVVKVKSNLPKLPKIRKKKRRRF